MVDRKKTKHRKPKGMAMETVGYLVLAVVALILLWVFLSSIAPDISNAIAGFAGEILCKICKEMVGGISLIVCTQCWT
jgi:hypothetical protein